MSYRNQKIEHDASMANQIVNIDEDAVSVARSISTGLPCKHMFTHLLFFILYSWLPI